MKVLIKVLPYQRKNYIDSGTFQIKVAIINIVEGNIAWFSEKLEHGFRSSQQDLHVKHPSYST